MEIIYHARDVATSERASGGRKSESLKTYGGVIKPDYGRSKS